jgi:8-oxo-dGTP diphosphatase
MPVRAAGGVLWRHTPTGELTIALVHRPRYDDWSLPKGKLHRDEPTLVAACREVLEETGVRPIAGPRLPSVSYPVAVSGGGTADKTVDYWAMRAGSASDFEPDHEVDDVAWLSIGDAVARLTYAHDVEVVNAFTALPQARDVVVLIRHGHAGERGSWPGPDTARPLDENGSQRSARLAEILRWYVPERLISAPPRRCVQTLHPLAGLLDRPIDVAAGFAEDADPVTAAADLRELGRAGGSTVVCSQGKIIPKVLAALDPDPAPASFRTPKGAGWVLTFAPDATLVSLDHL